MNTCSCLVAKSCPVLFANPWTVACQEVGSIYFSRGSSRPALADRFLPLSQQGSLTSYISNLISLKPCFNCEGESHSVVSNSVTHGPHSPWNSPGENTGVGSLLLLQGIFPTQGSKTQVFHIAGRTSFISNSPNLLAWLFWQNFQFKKKEWGWTQCITVTGSKMMGLHPGWSKRGTESELWTDNILDTSLAFWCCRDGRTFSTGPSVCVFSTLVSKESWRARNWKGI